MSDNRNSQRGKMIDTDHKGKGDGARKNVIEQEVRNMFKYGKTSISLNDMAKLKEKFTDAQLVDDMYKEFTRQYEKITEQAKDFANQIVEKYGTNSKPSHKILSKALQIKEKSGMSDAMFQEFTRLYERRLAGDQLEAYPARTAIGKALGESPITIVEGLTISDSDYKYLQEILKLHKESEPLHQQVMLQSLSYTDCPPQIFQGSYDKNKHNPTNHVHPLIAALFGPKVNFLDERFIFANIGYIVKCKYEKKPINTRPNYELYYDIVRDPNDVVCSVDSPMADLLNRFRLQIKVWESLLAFRLGQYYKDNLMGFLQVLDNCRSTIYESPESSFIKDEGTMLRKLLASTATRSIVVATTPTHGVISSNPHDRMTNVPKLKTVPMITIRFPPSTLHTAGIIKLEDALHQETMFFESNNMMIPYSQSVIYTRDVLFFYINRRFQNIDMIRFTQPYSFVGLPLTSSGYEELNEQPIFFNTYLKIGSRDEYDLRSVICIKKVTLGDECDPKYKSCPDMKKGGINLITGCSALLVKSRSADCIEDDSYFSYDPMKASISYTNKDGEFENPSPIEFIHGDLPFNTSEKTDTFFSKASRCGTIFMYVKRTAYGRF